MFILIPEVCLQGWGKSMCCRCESHRPVQIGQGGLLILLFACCHLDKEWTPTPKTMIMYTGNYKKRIHWFFVKLSLTPTKQLTQYYKFDRKILWRKRVNDMEISTVACQMPRWYKRLLKQDTFNIIQFQTIHLTIFTHRENDFFGALAQSYRKNIGQ